MLIAGAGLFGILLFLNYYLQQNLGFSPVRTGLAFLPMVALTMIGNTVSATVLMPRTGPRPLVTFGMLLAGGGGVWLARIGVHSSYATAILPAVLFVGAGLGLIFAPVVAAGTSGVPPRDTGVASATVNAGNQVGGWIGTSLLNTIFAGAVTGYIAARAVGRPSPDLIALAQVHGYTTAFWWSAGIFAAGAVLSAALMRSGPARPPGPAPGQDGAAGGEEWAPAASQDWPGPGVPPSQSGQRRPARRHQAPPTGQLMTSQQSRIRSTQTGTACGCEAMTAPRPELHRK
jgi:MFS family permease